MGHIHPSAIIDKEAKIHPSAQIGAFTVIQKNAVVGENCQIMHNATIEGPADIGAGTVIYPYTYIGGEPQILNYSAKNDTTSKIVIGKNCMIRENTNIHRGSAKGEGISRIGDNCMIMASVHIGHDCIIGNHVIISSFTAFAGHVNIGNNVIFSGMTGIAQFKSVGDYVFVTGKSTIRHTVPPFVVVEGSETAVARGVNIMGLRRNGFSQEQIKDIRDCYHTFFSKESVRSENVAEITRLFSKHEHVKPFVDFVSNHTDICHAVNKKSKKLS